MLNVGSHVIDSQVHLHVLVDLLWKCGQNKWCITPEFAPKTLVRATVSSSSVISLGRALKNLRAHSKCRDAWCRLTFVCSVTFMGTHGSECSNMKKKK